MSRQIQIRRGTASEHNNFTGAPGEITMDLTNKTLCVHDGSTQGGIKLAKKSEIPDVSQFAKKTEIPDVTIYAKKSELPNFENFVLTSELPNFETFALTSELPDFKTFALKSELPDFDTFAKKTEIPNLSTADYVIESWISSDKKTWYRKYKSGWIEQGGIYLAPQPERITMTFPKKMANNYYTVNVSFRGNPTSGGYSSGYRDMTETGMTIVFPYASEVGNMCSWSIYGTAA